jgi:hypothetical protein
MAVSARRQLRHLELQVAQRERDVERLSAQGAALLPRATVHAALELQTRALVRFGMLAAVPGTPPAPWLRHVQRMLDALTAGDVVCVSAVSAASCPPGGPQGCSAPPPPPGAPNGWCIGGSLPTRLQLELGWCPEAAAAALPAADLSEEAGRALFTRLATEGCCLVKWVGGLARVTQGAPPRDGSAVTRGCSR